MRPQSRTGPALQDSALEPLPLRDLWPILNRTRQVEGSTIRLACVLLLAVYTVSSVVRHMSDPLMLGIRAIVFAYTIIGIIVGPRFEWATLRAYTVGMALLLPASTAALQILRGNHPADLAITALATFAPLPFLQAGTDVVIVSVMLIAGIIALVTGFGPPGVPMEVAGIVLGGAVVAGAATALVLLAYRGRINDRTAWWQEACARERALREFVELAAPHLGDHVLAREFAARMRTAFGTGHCAIVFVDPESSTPRVLATAGGSVVDESDTIVEPRALTALLERIDDRQPIVRESLSADEVQRTFAGLPGLTAGGTLVVLPIADDAVRGAIVLSAAGARPVAEEELLVWRAMANQVGVAVGSARLFMRLQAALRTRTEFINTMSHELRSPLHVILGYAEMLEEQKQSPNFIAERVRASALELLQMVENTLAAAHLGSGKMRLQPSEFPLAELVAELRESAAAAPEAASGATLRWEVAPDLPVVRLDRLKMKEIVQNLISNALKFTPHGEIVVRIGRDGRQIRIDVEDTGSGIPHDAQARIFDMFERIEPPQGARTPGVGLGLYIVKSLTQMMGGTVTLRSEPGRGAQFTVRLPMGMG